jgi:hypothetical protein
MYYNTYFITTHIRIQLPADYLTTEEAVPFLHRGKCLALQSKILSQRNIKENSNLYRILKPGFLIICRRGDYYGLPV